MSENISGALTCFKGKIMIIFPLKWDNSGKHWAFINEEARIKFKHILIPKVGVSDKAFACKLSDSSGNAIVRKLTTKERQSTDWKKWEVSDQSNDFPFDTKPLQEEVTPTIVLLENL